MANLYANSDAVSCASSPKETVVSVLLDIISAEECISDTLNSFDYSLFGTCTSEANTPNHPENLGEAMMFLRDIVQDNRKHLNQIYDRVGGR